MSVRHFNRNRSKVMPKAYADCSSRPARNRRQAKRDKRVSDRREAKLNREMALARNFVGAAI